MSWNKKYTKAQKASYFLRRSQYFFKQSQKVEKYSSRWAQLVTRAGYYSRKAAAIQGATPY